MPVGWIDTHCHLDAPAFGPDRDVMRDRATAAGVSICVIPATGTGNFDAVRDLAHRWGDAYALGLHPMYLGEAGDEALGQLDQALQRHAGDPRLVAVGEIGLDYFVPRLASGPARARQDRLYREQLKLARRHGLPVLLHSRRSVDQVLKGLREIEVPGGIAHAFSGSRQQADMFLQLGLKLGFGGAMTFEPATRLRRLAVELPEDAIVMETDAPDIPPHWLYRSAQERRQGQTQGRNEPGELPRIGAVLAGLRGVPADDWACMSSANALQALPGLRALLQQPRVNPR